MLNRLAYAAVGAVFVVMMLGVSSPAPAKKGGGGKGGGGDDGGNEKLPLTIEFADDLGDRIASDGLPYLDGAAGVEAFVGSQAKTGDILLKLLDAPSRTINLDFTGGTSDSIDSACPAIGLPVDQLQFLEVNASDGSGTPNGVYDLSDGGTSEVQVSMRLRYIDSDGEAWFLNFGTGERKLCGSSTYSHDRVWVTKTAGQDQWTVHTAAGESTACLERSGGSGGVKAKFCGRYEMPFSFAATPTE